jgi:rRNA maturation endonuclease Nob1
MECVTKLTGDTLDLLETARVVTFPDKDKSITHWYGCGACGKAVNPGDKFCRECGRELKWDE